MLALVTASQMAFASAASFFSLQAKRPESVPELTDRRLIILLVSPKRSVGG
jgi:hypothetical protein